jgi:hypothetical protein
LTVKTLPAMFSVPIRGAPLELAATL